MISTFLDLTVRIGCKLEYETSMPTPALFVLRPRVDDSHLVTAEQFTVTPGLVNQEYQDVHGNITRRATLQAGLNTVAHDALVSVSSTPEELFSGKPAVPVAEIPAEVLRYTLPSRYCDSDKLLAFAWDNFGQVENGACRQSVIGFTRTFNTVSARGGPTFQRRTLSSAGMGCAATLHIR